MAVSAAEAFKFATYPIAEYEVFFRSVLCFGFVNTKPLCRGHVLVSPKRVVDRYNNLTEEEVADMAISTQKITRIIEKHYKASSLSIAIQDGPGAGQTVPHVHTHIIPRHYGDFVPNDKIYEALESIGKAEDTRVNRTPKEMADEAAELRSYFTSTSHQ